jgi:DNA-directed RNA polymerase specialized sigma24 family protein
MQLVTRQLVTRRSATRAASGGAPGGGASDRLDRSLAGLADGLFTYCLSVLCDGDEAAAAVQTVRRLAHRHRRRLRRDDLIRAWLYALARQVCLTWLELRPMSERSAGLRPAGSAGSAGPSGRQRAQLALLVWPEAAGTTSEQREALELALRHGLVPDELAAVLGVSEQSARRLVTQAVCEVERTRAALTVLASGACPVLARLGCGAAAHGPASTLGPTLRGELVRHVDECPTCRGTAEQATAGGPWPGTTRPPGTLPLVSASAAAAAERGADWVEPRFDRDGFPVQRVRNPERVAVLRHRAVLTTAVAAVVAAPALALWAAQRGESDQVAAAGHEAPVGTPESPPEMGPASETANATPGAPGAPGTPAAPRTAPSAGGREEAGGAVPAAPPGSRGSRPPARVGRLSVHAEESFGRTVITISNTGDGKASWWAVTDAPWLRLSRASGVLGPGERVMVLVTVDEGGEPRGAWTARVSVQPSSAIVPVHGAGRPARQGRQDPQGRVENSSWSRDPQPDRHDGGGYPRHADHHRERSTGGRRG